MDRRRHIARTENAPAAAARPRPAAASTAVLYCWPVQAGELEGGQTTDTGSLGIYAGGPRQRVFLATTLWGISSVTTPTWTVTFRVVNRTVGQWSDYWTSDVACSLTGIHLDAELDDRERALVNVWIETPNYDYGGQWGYNYWSSIYLEGVGVIPRPPSDPLYNPLRDRRYIKNLYGSIHRTEGQFGPDDGIADYYGLLENGTNPVPFPVAIPPGSYVGAWFEPDLVGYHPSYPVYMEYNIDTGVGILMPAVPFTGTVTYYFESAEPHANVVFQQIG